MERRRPDTVTIHRDNTERLIIDIGVPEDARVKAKEQEKVEKYQDLKMDIANTWNMKRVTVIPVVVGALEAVPTGLEKWVEKIEIKVRVEHLQKPALLGTARILRMVLMQ